MPTAKDKGKGKARAAPPSERSPLLSAAHPNSYASSSASALQDDITVVPLARRRPSRRYALGAALLSLFLAFMAFIVVLGASFVPSEREVQDLPDSFKYSTPTVHILNVDDSGVHVNVELLGGVDVNKALAVDGSRGAGWWEGVRQSAAHTLFGALPQQAVHVRVPGVLVYARGGGLPLLNVSLPADIVVPLVQGEDLKPLSIEAIGVPVAPVGEIWQWAQHAWAQGNTEIILGMREVEARLPGSWLSRWAKYTDQDLAFPLEFNVPRLPNFPPPGKPLNLSSLVKLHNYTLSNTDGMKISALASLPNPGIGEMPFPLPFAIELEGTRMAEVVARTAKIDKHKINLSLDGDIIVSSSSDALSVFLRNFLHGKDSPIVVRGLNGMPKRYSGPNPPAFVLHTLPSLALDLLFPAPHPAPQIVRSVTVDGMKLSQGEESMECSGTVVALVQLPDGLESVDLDVAAIRPDVLIYDGKADDNADKPDPGHPPPGAFARIAPSYYLNSTTSHSDDPATPYGLVVKAPFEKVPLQMLEGRESIFRNFVGKVIFKGGANAGIGGIVDVEADLGVGDVVTILNLPVTGDFWVGRSAGFSTLLDKLEAHASHLSAFEEVLATLS